ncbi:aminomethyl transferase family protein [Roseibacterium elongatum DSM 19469]|uniref:Aminomethyl transferase family protein n=1 Tax=Roseicyclus elongatus DSM 19469 TaxID=1294273 RepID=W8RZ08_9RHOB|nr:glycine cleavage T C-terminal barrel domain-containing protein [Roseibacterium elongatum]AHM03102.1 aminomethyl transferase family protein [Roseibacterium elongatum DSM 19469]
MSYSIHIGPNIRKSPYYEATVADRVQSFSVYNHMFIPGHFGDPAGEYHRLIHGVAMWDVAAQRQVELLGPDAWKLAQVLTPRDLSNTMIGQGRYVPLCDHDGWLINDPVLLPLAEDRVWLSIADSDIALWAKAIGRERGLDVEVHEPDVAPLAIQGPKAMDVAEALLGDWVRDLRHFQFREADLDGIPLIVARSGWSKQGGVELYLQDNAQGTRLWQMVKEAGAPWDIGPGAPNDVERLESGLISYGADMRWQSLPANPFEMGFGAMVHLDAGHDFVGRAALDRIKAEGIKRRLTGVFVEGAPVAGNQHPLPLMQHGQPVGHVSEIAHSPRLERNIAIGLVPADLDENAEGLSIGLDGTARAITLTALPFIA